MVKPNQSPRLLNTRRFSSLVNRPVERVYWTDSQNQFKTVRHPLAQRIVRESQHPGFDGVLYTAKGHIDPAVGRSLHTLLTGIKGSLLVGTPVQNHYHTHLLKPVWLKERSQLKPFILSIFKDLEAKKTLDTTGKAPLFSTTFRGIITGLDPETGKTFLARTPELRHAYRGGRFVWGESREVGPTSQIAERMAEMGRTIHAILQKKPPLSNLTPRLVIYPWDKSQPVILTPKSDNHDLIIPALEKSIQYLE